MKTQGALEGKSEETNDPHKNKRLARRRFLLLGSGLAVSAIPMLALAPREEKNDPDEGVTAPEDLMKEHGVLNRCLLVYEEGMRRLQRRGSDASPEIFHHTAQLVKKFVEEYHEKNEENFIFPQFE